jgi:cell division protein FtsZ
MGEMGMAMMGSGTASGVDRAREAAEAAVSSPLLEDINLAGANGILVNVTAGEDLSIGEFNVIGDTVKAFASDDATVIVGTVIDPAMGSNIRVTVVATGLGRGLRLVQPINRPNREPEPAVATQQIQSRPALAGADTDWRNFDLPAHRRKQQAAVGHDVVDSQEDFDLLDIPAFLRRQAD